MGAAAIPVVVLFLLLFISWRMVLTYNRDLIRAKAWGELIRRALPFAALSLMALTLLPVLSVQQEWARTVWAIGSVVAVFLANIFSITMSERRANRAFRKGDYQKAIDEYSELAEDNPLARHNAFLAAALGAKGENEESLKVANKAVKLDPEYGIAYYNRALVLNRMGRKSRSIKDLRRALETDLPRRLKNQARGLLEELT
ncbi:MAG: tetratricopeptide repeat protein [Rubrobacteraceae bacterium]